MPRSFSSFDSRSDFSIETVPTSAGGPSLLLDDVGDDRFAFLLLGPVDRVRLFDAPHLAVGRDDHDLELVILWNSSASVSAVPVIPESLPYLRK